MPSSNWRYERGVLISVRRKLRSRMESGVRRRVEIVSGGGSSRDFDLAPAASTSILIAFDSNLGRGGRERSDWRARRTGDVRFPCPSTLLSQSIPTFDSTTLSPTPPPPPQRLLLPPSVRPSPFDVLPLFLSFFFLYRFGSFFISYFLFFLLYPTNY